MNTVEYFLWKKSTYNIFHIWIHTIISIEFRFLRHFTLLLHLGLLRAYFIPLGWHSNIFNLFQHIYLYTCIIQVACISLLSYENEIGLHVVRLDQDRPTWLRLFFSRCTVEARARWRHQPHTKTAVCQPMSSIGRFRERWNKECLKLVSYLHLYVLMPGLSL